MSTLFCNPSKLLWTAFREPDKRSKEIGNLHRNNLSGGTSIDALFGRIWIHWRYFYFYFCIHWGNCPYLTISGRWETVTLGKWIERRLWDVKWRWREAHTTDESNHFIRNCYTVKYSLKIFCDGTTQHCRTLTNNCMFLPCHVRISEWIHTL